jgi:hypothetical protein
MGVQAASNMPVPVFDGLGHATQQIRRERTPGKVSLS